MKLFINGPGVILDMEAPLVQQTDNNNILNSYVMLNYASTCIVRAGYEWLRGRVPILQVTRKPTPAELSAARATEPQREWPETCDLVVIEGLTSKAGKKLNGREGIVFGREDSSSGRCQVFVMPEYLSPHVWSHLGQHELHVGFQGYMGQT